MKVGIVSDIHCNAEALRAAFDLMADVDEVLCLGDSIYDYRFSNDVVALLRKRRAHVIQGNHEETFFGKKGARARAQSDNDPELMEWLAGMPARRELHFADKTILMVHSTPWEPRGEYIYPSNPMLTRFAEHPADFILYGHTHVPLAKRISHTVVINPGSTGESRNVNGASVSGCAILDLATGEAELVSFPWVPPANR